MRYALLAMLYAAAARAQFKSTVPLVVAPTTVMDSKGRYVDGLEAADLILYDNGVPQAVQVDLAVFPISLVVAVQRSTNAWAVLGKLGGGGSLFADLLAGDAGETAVLAFHREVSVVQDFTADSALLKRAVRGLRAEGDGASALDALTEALRMLNTRPPARRRVVLMIAEKRDRSSSAKLEEVMAEIHRQNVAIYWLTWSPALSPYTNRHIATRGEMEDQSRQAWWERDREKEEEPVPPPVQPGGLIPVLLELYHLSKPDVAELASRTTGARTIGFWRKKGFEEAVQAVGEEVHRQYILTFQPRQTEPGRYHNIRVEVRGRPELRTKTRTGYWATE